MQVALLMRLKSFNLYSLPNDRTESSRTYAVLQSLRLSYVLHPLSQNSLSFKKHRVNLSTSIKSNIFPSFPPCNSFQFRSIPFYKSHIYILATSAGCCSSLILMGCCCSSELLLFQSVRVDESIGQRKCTCDERQKAEEGSLPRLGFYVEEQATLTGWDRRCVP